MMKQYNRNIPKGYKDSSLGIIPEEWNVKRLGDCCLNNGDYGINAAAVNFSNKLPAYLRITDIDEDGKLISKGRKSVNDINSQNYYLNDGDIVFARTGATVGKTFLYNADNDKLVFAGFLIRFVPNNQLLLSYYLKSITNTNAYWNWVKTVSVRSGQPGINSIEYCSLPILVPPLSEQRKISEILSTWDEAIEQQSKLVDALTLRKRGLMQQLLTGKRRIPGFNKEWKKTKIKSIAYEIFLKNQDNTNLTVLSCTKYNGLVPSLEYFGKQIFSNDTSSYKIVPKNSFAYATNHIEEGSIGYQNNYEQALISPMYTVFTTSDAVNNHYIYALLKSNICISEYRKRMEGSIDRRGGLRWKVFSNIPLKLPTLKEQNAIIQILTTVNNELDLANCRLEMLKREKRGLMQQLLTGKIRIKI